MYENTVAISPRVLPFKDLLELILSLPNKPRLGSHPINLADRYGKRLFF